MNIVTGSRWVWAESVWTVTDIVHTGTGVVVMLSSGIKTAVMPLYQFQIEARDAS
jgi:hypothetical protein